ncbi:Hydrophobin, partial [Amanita muscaria]
GGSDCNTGSINCCESVQSTTDPAVQTLAGLFNIALPNAAALVGVHCNPISALALSSNSCSEQPACCTGNQMAGVLTFGCNPLNADL